MDPKPRPHDDIYLDVLRRMTPEQRLRKAFELGEMGRELRRAGLRLQHPDLGEDAISALEVEEALQWHNRNC